LFVGSIVRRKNPLKLASAIKNLGYRGVFIGTVPDIDYEYAREFEKVVAESDRLLWLRNLPHGDPLSPSAFGAAAVFCMPSDDETQPAAALEGMAAKLPVILGDKPYAHETPFQNVARCDPSNLKSIEACLQSVMTNPDEHRQSLPEAYTWPHVATEIARIYQSLSDGNAD
jgi:glycosyltransferase involved in cell wall biosynthesis